jgi:hypothetical protein
MAFFVPVPALSALEARDCRRRLEALPFPGRTIARGSEGDRGLDIGSIARQYRAMTATPTDAIGVVNDGRRGAAPVNVSR